MRPPCRTKVGAAMLEPGAHWSGPVRPWHRETWFGEVWLRLGEAPSS